MSPRAGDAEDALAKPDLPDANGGPRFLDLPSIFSVGDMRHDVGEQLAARPGF
jgi:hypothetical protein